MSTIINLPDHFTFVHNADLDGAHAAEWLRAAYPDITNVRHANIETNGLAVGHTGGLVLALSTNGALMMFEGEEWDRHPMKARFEAASPMRSADSGIERAEYPEHDEECSAYYGGCCECRACCDMRAE